MPPIRSALALTKSATGESMPLRSSGGIGAEPENLMHMRSVADRLFGDDYYLSVLAAGRHQMPFSTLSAVLGGNVRVGLEDNIYINKGELATSNTVLVERAVNVSAASIRAA